MTNLSVCMCTSLYGFRTSFGVNWCSAAEVSEVSQIILTAYNSSFSFIPSLHCSYKIKKDSVIKEATDCTVLFLKAAYDSAPRSQLPKPEEIELLLLVCGPAQFQRQRFCSFIVGSRYCPWGM